MILAFLFYVSIQKSKRLKNREVGIYWTNKQLKIARTLGSLNNFMLFGISLCYLAIERSSFFPYVCNIVDKFFVIIIKFTFIILTKKKTSFVVMDLVAKDNIYMYLICPSLFNLHNAIGNTNLKNI